MTPEDKKDSEFETRKKQAQVEVGTLMWLTIKTRPDIGPVVGIAASHIAHNPGESLRLCEGIWKYLAMTAALECTWSKQMKEGYRYTGKETYLLS